MHLKYWLLYLCDINISVMLNLNIRSMYLTSNSTTVSTSEANTPGLQDNFSVP